MCFLVRRFVASIFLGGFTVSVVTTPVWSSASASGGTTQPAPAASTSASAERDAVRAAEASARFFEPLLAEVKTPAERASLLHQRGVLYLRSYMKTKALADLNEAMRLLPAIDAERSEVAFHRACALLLPDKPNPKAAISDIAVRLTEYPDDAEALVVRALAYRMTGEMEKADADWKRATALAPKEDTAMHAFLEYLKDRTP